MLFEFEFCAGCVGVIFVRRFWGKNNNQRNIRFLWCLLIWSSGSGALPFEARIVFCVEYFSEVSEGKKQRNIPFFVGSLW